MYIDKLDDIVNRFNNTYHSTNKKKPVNVVPSTSIDSSKEINNEDPKFKIGGTVRISKYKNVFGKGYTPNWSGEIFVILVWQTFAISDLKGEQIAGTFYETELQKTNQKEFRIEKVIKRKGHKYLRSISTNMYIDKLDDIVNRFNNTYHSTNKKKPVNVVPSTSIDSSKEINNEDPKFKIGGTVRISKYKNVFGKGYTPNWSGEIFVILVRQTFAISDLKGEQIAGKFYQTELQKTNQRKFRIEKVIKRKGNKLYVEQKGYDVSFTWTDKKDKVRRSEYFPEQNSLGGRMKVKLDLSNYATNTDFIIVKTADTSTFAKKVDFANLKSNVDKLDIDKIKNVPPNLRIQ